MLESSDISEMITTDLTISLYLSCINTVLLLYVVLFALKCWACRPKYTEMPTDYLTSRNQMRLHVRPLLFLCRS